MTLINDNLEGVKASILMAIKNELVETYPKEFGDYRTSRDDVYSKVFWESTVRYQPKYPYCILSCDKDISEGYDEIYTFKDSDGILKKRVVTRSYMTISIDVFAMGNEHTGMSSLQADNFAHKVARQLRKYFNGDGKLDWFSGNEYYPKQIGIRVTSDVNAIPKWEDTDAEFRYYFTINVGWDDIQDSEAELATGAEIRTSENDKNIDTTTIYFKKQ